MTAGLTPLTPGSWLGIFGGGQLGRMIAMAARRLDYRTRVLDPQQWCPAAQAADEQIVAAYTDVDAAMKLAEGTAAIACEFENVDATALEAAERRRTVFPPARVLRVAQDRLAEKSTLAELGFPVPPFRPVLAGDDMDSALGEIGTPGVLKTATMGYDGKGQRVIREAGEGAGAYRALAPNGQPLIYEQFVPFVRELSVIAARDRQGRVRCFPAVENVHVDGILDTTIAPARVSPEVRARAERLAAGIIERLDSIGLICVEMFLAGDGGLMVNELAPRPHNSGHYTLDAGMTSQFEQLVRVMCNLPLGDTTPSTPAVMVNLLGDIWQRTGGRPDFAAALDVPGASLHLYGKAEARPGRKMGHITAVAPDVDTALERAREARARLEG